MSVFFNSYIPLCNNCDYSTGDFRVIRESNTIEFYLITDEETKFSSSVNIDLDVIEIISGRILFDLNKIYLNISGKISDLDITLKLKAGSPFINRGLLFSFLENYYKSKLFRGVDEINLPETEKEPYIKGKTKLFDYQQRYLEWISNTENDIISNDNAFIVPEKFTIRTDNICYNLINKTIFFIDKRNEKYKIKNSFKGSSLVLGECMGKTTLACAVIVSTLKSKFIKPRRIINGELIQSKATLVICELGDIPVYINTLRNMDPFINIVTIKNNREYIKAIYYNLIDSDVVLIPSNFYAVLRNNSDIQSYLLNDLIKNENLINVNKPELSLIKFKRLIVDLRDSNTVFDKLKKLKFNMFIHITSIYNSRVRELLFTEQNVCNYPKERLISKKTYDSFFIYLETTNNINTIKELSYIPDKKQKILEKIIISKPDISFEVSPAAYCQAINIKTIVATKDQAKNIISRFSRSGFSGDLSGECPICLNEVLDDQVITICGHSFCNNCLKNSLSVNKSCPVCRASVNSSNYIYISEEVSDEVCLSYSEIIKKTHGSLMHEVLNFLIKFKDDKNIIYCENSFILKAVESVLKNTVIKYFPVNKKISDIKKFLSFKGGAILLITENTKISKSNFLSVKNVILLNSGEINNSFLERLYSVNKKNINKNIVKFVSN